MKQSFGLWVHGGGHGSGIQIQSTYGGGREGMENGMSETGGKEWERRGQEAVQPRLAAFNGGAIQERAVALIAGRAKTH